MSSLKLQKTTFENCFTLNVILKFYVLFKLKYFDVIIFRIMKK